MPRPISVVVKSYCEAVKFRISSQLINWVIFIAQRAARSLNSVDAKIHQRPPSLDLLILQNMLSIVEDLPRLQLSGEFRPEAQVGSAVTHFSSIPTAKKGQTYLRQIISIPVKGALRMAFKLLRSLQRLDIKLHHRSPRILTVLKCTLDTAENTRRLIEELKFTDEAGILQSRISQGKSLAIT